MLDHSQQKATLLAITKFLDDHCVTLTGTDKSDQLKVLMQQVYELNYQVYRSLPQSSQNDVLAFCLVDPRFATLKKVGKLVEGTFLGHSGRIDLDLHTQVAKLCGKIIKMNPGVLLAKSLEVLVLSKSLDNKKISPIAAANLM